MNDDRLDDLVAPLRAAPERFAVLLDVDGTLAPITRHASETAVPEVTKRLLVALAARYGLVACVSGRRAADAREIVGLDELAYVGNHGSELLRRGTTEVETRPQVAAWESRVRAIAERLLGERPDAAAAGIRLEDKGPIQALHWRGAADETAAGRIAGELGAAAASTGLALHEGRMVLELRPRVAFDKGEAIRWLLGAGDFRGGLYAGDDHTDLDAFVGLRELREAAIIETAVCVAARDDESPAAVAEAADLVVAGPDGIRDLLQELLRP